MSKDLITLSCDVCGCSFWAKRKIAKTVIVCPFCGAVKRGNRFQSLIHQENEKTAQARYVYNSQYNTTDAQKFRAEAILNSNLDYERKLIELSYNPFSKRNIVQYILTHGINVELIFHPEKMLDDQGNDFRDFIESDNNFYFGAIAQIGNRVGFGFLEDEQTAINYKTAITLWGALNELYCAVPGIVTDGEDFDMEAFDIEEFESFYQLAMDNVKRCSEYAFTYSPDDKTWLKDKKQYVEAQQEYITETLCNALPRKHEKAFRKFCKKTIKSM